MRIDYSQAAAWHTCPALWQEKYQRGIELDWNALTGGIGFGRRMHQLLEEYYTGKQLYPPSTNEQTETEAQAMLAAYKIVYAGEKLDIVDVERVFEVPLAPVECAHCGESLSGFGENGDSLDVRAWEWAGRKGCVLCKWCGEVTLLRHTYTGKIDLVCVNPEGLELIDHKTEKRGGTENTVEAWATKPQVALYKWALSQLYAKPVLKITINVLTRQSEKGQIGPTFGRVPVGKDALLVREAVQDLTWVADTIEQMQKQFGGDPWPKDRDRCRIFRTKCAYYDLHLFGESEQLLTKFKKTEPYLGL